MQSMETKLFMMQGAKPMQSWKEYSRDKNGSGQQPDQS
jgi:hypothetical protein